ncbi:enoyl CoA hydratase domain-containing protein 1 [Mortierella sp. AM989]|nr:enoyl CoA hydratase domain-containing protein 1 [Mortierella sp. AM989]
MMYNLASTSRLFKASSLFTHNHTIYRFAPIRYVQQQQQRRNYACQIHHPTKLGQLRAKFRQFGEGHIELDLNHSPGLAILTLHNPSKHNSLTGKMIAELGDCVDFLEEATISASFLTPVTFTSVTKMARTQSHGDTSERSSAASSSSVNEQIPQLYPGSGLVLKSGGKVIESLEQEHVEILDNLVGIIVTGSANKSYCAGLDISAAKTTLLSSQAGSEMSTLMVSSLTRFMRLPLLTIAAIEHAAIGGGAELTTFCDHRCMSETAKIQFVQTEMGVVPGWGGASRLLNIVSRSQALRLLGAAEPIQGGQEAVQCGFAQISAPAQKTVEVATEYMQRYVWHKPPSSSENNTGGDESQGARRCVPAVRAMKRIVSHGMDHDRVDRVSEFEKDLFKQFWGGDDNLARVAAAFSGNKKKN